MASDQLTCIVTCPQCGDPIAMPTTSRHPRQGPAEVHFDTSAVRAHIAAHGLVVESPTPPGPGEQIISDAYVYPDIRKDGYRFAELLGWLKANGIEPNDIPVHTTISIAPSDSGDGQVIRYTVYVRDAGGIVRGDTALEDRATPLTVPLPDTWPQPLGPIAPGTPLQED